MRKAIDMKNVDRVNMSKQFFKPVRNLAHIALAAVGLVLSVPITVEAQSYAQEEVFVGIDINERMRPNGGLSPHDNTLLGDSIDPNTGSLSFETVDVSLPGNFDLPVEIRRRLNPSQTLHNEFEDWQLMTPSIGTKILDPEWQSGTGWAKTRCTDTNANSIPDSVDSTIPLNNKTVPKTDYSDGVVISIPGRISEQVLDVSTTDKWPSTAKKVTKSNWYLTCISNIDGAGTEGFTAYAPNGDVYTFDVVSAREYVSAIDRWAVQRDTTYVQGQTFIYDSVFYSFVPVNYDVLRVSEVKDKHGNWVKYEYNSSGQVDRIYSSDDREITINYDVANDRISSVTANPNTADARTWNYSYVSRSPTEYRAPEFAHGIATYAGKTRKILHTVSLPNGRSWTYETAGIASPSVAGDHYTSNSTQVDCIQAPQTVTVTHPDGVQGVFQIAEKTRFLNFHPGGQKGPPCPATTGGYNEHNTYSDVMAVTSKTLTSPGGTPSVWSYEYRNGGWGSEPGSDDDGFNKTIITKPDGSIARHLFDLNVGSSHSSVKSIDVFEAADYPNTPLSTTSFEYQFEEVDAGSTFLTKSPKDVEQPLLTTKVTITRGSDTYTTELFYHSDRSLSNYDYGKPYQVDEYSSVQSGTRSAVTTYIHNTTDWLLGMVDTVTRNGTLIRDNDYDSDDRLEDVKLFGQVVASYTYHPPASSSKQAGQIATATDAAGNVWTYDDYKRGQPGLVVLPTLDDEYEIDVDDDGWITAITDPRNLTTTYEYDPIGRLKKITPPAVNGATIETNFNYTYSTSGLLTQTVTKANLKITTDFDGFLRPVLVKTEDVDISGSASFLRTGYDGLGREVFSSFPSEVDTAADGIVTEYDALGRIREMHQNVAPNASTTYDYLPGNKIKATDPRGKVTTTTYEGFGSPEDLGGERALPTHIDMPTGEDISIGYDIWGKKEFATMGSATTEYHYDSRFRLEWVEDPSDKRTYTYYDDANRPIVIVDAEGRKTLTVYDEMSRPEKIIKAWRGNNDGTGSTQNCAEMRGLYNPGTGYLQQCYQEVQYSPTGLIESVIDAKGNKTYHEYDAFDRLTHTYFPSKTNVGEYSTTDFEQVTFDPFGFPTSIKTRSGQTITYNHDALGRLRYRTVPGAPTHSAFGQTVSHSFTYDAAGRRLSAKHDGIELTYQYDAIGRIEWQKHNGSKTVSYEYDAANNLKKLTYPDGTWVVEYDYDDLNRVTRAYHDGDTLADVGYDPLGRRESVTYYHDFAGASPTTSKVYYDHSDRGDLECMAWNIFGTAPSTCSHAEMEVEYGFAYNGVGQLTAETVSDALLNWLPSESRTDSYQVNGLNQYKDINGSIPEYDGDGNLTRFSANTSGLTFTYDAENMLRTAANLPGGGTATYKYYADGARAEKDVNGTTTQFYYMGGLGYLAAEDTEFAANQEIAEYDGNTLLRRYVRLPGSVDEAFVMIEANGDERWAYTNRLGSVVMTADESGTIADRYTYSPYGEPGGAGDGFPFRYTGQKLDPETGLYYYKARYYDPETGRFLQTDPIGYSGGMNLYGYVFNDPINLTDPAGTKPRRANNFGRAVAIGISEVRGRQTALSRGSINGKGASSKRAETLIIKQPSYVVKLRDFGGGGNAVVVVPDRFYALTDYIAGDEVWDRRSPDLAVGGEQWTGRTGTDSRTQALVQGRGRPTRRRSLTASQRRFLARTTPFNFERERLAEVQKKVGYQVIGFITTTDEGGDPITFAYTVDDEGNLTGLSQVVEGAVDEHDVGDLVDGIKPCGEGPNSRC